MIKIVIVEDEIDLAQNLKETLEILGYHVLTIFTNAKDTLQFLNSNHSDLIIMDIMLEGSMDGIELTNRIKTNFDIPVLFLTAFSNVKIFDRISKVNHEGFLLKPFTLENLKSAVYLSLKKEKTEQKIPAQKYLKIRDKGFLIPLPESNVLFLKADGLYTKVYTSSKVYSVRETLKDMTAKVSAEKFTRVHKSYLVNIQYIEYFNSKELIILDNNIPIKRGFYKKLKSLILSDLS